MQNDYQSRLLDQLKGLLKVGPHLDTAVVACVRRLRDAGVTWRAIGDANSMTRQAAIMKWGRKVKRVQPHAQPSPATAEDLRNLIDPANSVDIGPSESQSNGGRYYTPTGATHR